ncbi:threonine synthase [Suttonella sp. R2A3]|uniref:threonine synthase n=1 Tax=Suttonella sp. R2A3 TaxID=2908648 RepID=UPI001F244BC7|nr:threonine synthase [Suttonella sp. R2A3]UJF23658.1 threonine synthase [Suttonella sp. R2A3]
MNYVSTRGGASLGQFCDVLLSGLAPDGGLAMPERIVQISHEDLAHWRTLSYADLAYEVMRPYISDIPAEDLRAIVHKTYREDVFHSADIAPLTRLGEDELYLLELSNGPSLAFKDMAMQFLGHAFEYVLEQRKQTINILGATSGDTGSAAEYAMIGKDNVRVFMLSPHGRMSAFQQAQMFSIDEANIHNIALRGVFDDCQDLVKAVNADAAFKREHHIGAVNSINWARVLAQAVYYFKAYLALDIAIGEPVDVCVPSGNFGNIFAGYLAKQMGLPLGKLLVATNENDVLHEFFTHGVYRIRPSADVAKTSSPSMDIGKASNFERYLYLISGNNGAQVAQWWQALERQGEIDLRGTPFWQAVQTSDFASGRSTHAQRLTTIRETYARYDRLIDPHTADGVFVAQQHRANIITTHPMICLETALPVKFTDTVIEAVGEAPPRPARFANIEDAPRHVDVLDNDLDALKAYIKQRV